ncbi:MAG: glycosyltransferase family 4 protein [Conexivisphaerales archaeon]
MRIVVFNNCNPGIVGGQENLFNVFCSRLQIAGNEVFAIFPERKRLDPSLKINYKTLPFKERFKIKIYSLDIFSIYRVLKEVNPDIIHLNDGFSPTDLLIILVNKILLKKPIFIDLMALYRSPIINVFVKMQIPVYNLCTKVAFSSPKMERLSRHWFLAKNKIIHNYWPEYVGQDFKVSRSFGQKNDKFRFIFIGVLDENHSYKGLDLLLRAVMAFNRMNDELARKVDFAIVGSGNLFEKFEKFSTDNHLYNVHFLGRVDDVGDELRKSNALVLPSKKRGEGFGKVVLEALSYGLPVLVSKYAGSSYIVTDYGVGELFNPYKSVEAANKLKEFIDMCLKGKYNDKIHEFQALFLKEQKRSMDIILEEYRKAMV